MRPLLALFLTCLDAKYNAIYNKKLKKSGKSSPFSEAKICQKWTLETICSFFFLQSATQILSSTGKLNTISSSPAANLLPRFFFVLLLLFFAQPLALEEARQVGHKTVPRQVYRDELLLVRLIRSLSLSLLLLLLDSVSPFLWGVHQSLAQQSSGVTSNDVCKMLMMSNECLRVSLL